MSDTAHTIEQNLLNSLHGRLTGAAVHAFKDTSPTFDLVTDSETHGITIAYLLTSEDTTYQSFMVAHLKRDLGHDPAHDAEAIAFIRAGCPTIRRFINDDAVARQFARLVAYHALTTFKALCDQAANQRAGMN